MAFCCSVLFSVGSHGSFEHNCVIKRLKFCFSLLLKDLLDLEKASVGILSGLFVLLVRLPPTVLAQQLWFDQIMSHRSVAGERFEGRIRRACRWRRLCDVCVVVVLIY